ncbi:ABC-F family ATP-binding cassette domain-containing protein [Lentibacillus amyloliquefaciens]|uniref:Multidrug ABC transporter ATP-binding protein n=1 Tax=Lentibacillus amyloliquefaciens TaxID=1472767 RepID=A0A0U4F869_9BACI|nr:ABC-F family ATP-binding cassette domain-containing protein [Lentibacillus amyloliquefaciens]ALX48995.1 multidrug ABC transporter ATP-binding protein [Lentibacillus amyloliquefaciens]
MLTVENLYKSYGDKTLLNNISCIIKPNARIGLIGVNGTGKSTFLKVLAGIDTAEKGTIDHPKHYKIEYLAQEPDLEDDLTVIEQIYYGEAVIMKVMREYEQVLLDLQRNPENEKNQERLLVKQQQMDEVEAWEANTAAKTVLTKLGVTDYHKRVAELSGGQRKRVAIAKALIQPADLLILDEPTNHLDNETVDWLENYLASYKGALLLVTHDRYFLNRVTNQIYELDKGNLYIYEGNYEVFLEKKAEREALEKSYEEKHQNTLRRELAWLKRGPKARGTKQKARVERAEEMKKQTFDTTSRDVSFEAGSTRLGNKVLELEGVEKGYEAGTLISNFDFMVVPGDRLGIVGPNGTGKTTLLNIMAGRIHPDKGEVEIGQTVKIGYYTQNDEEFDGDKRIIEYIRETAEVVHTKKGEVITAEQMLERFLFSRRQQWNYIRKLSGGERRRLYVLKVLMQEPNVLLLDEPTNDLDTQTLGVLEDYLDQFPGVVITVSHDRYFLDRVVDHMLVFKEDAPIEHFYGNYSELLEREKQQDKQTPKSDKKTQKKPAPKKKMSYHDKIEWETIEDDITELETKLEELQEQIAGAGSDAGKVQDLYNEQQEVEEKLEAKMERWEELSLIAQELGQ